MFNDMCLVTVQQHTPHFDSILEYTLHYRLQ